MTLKTFFKKKVSILWLLAALMFFVIALTQIILLLLAGAGYNSLTGYIKEGHLNCAKYCEGAGEPLYLHDVVTQACQCYDENENPTDYINLHSGVETRYNKEG